MKIEKITEGIRKYDDNIVLDMTNDTDFDMIKTVSSPSIYKSSLGDNIYYFGYMLNNDIQDNIYRKEIINWLKSQNRKNLSPDMDKFLCRPVKQLLSIIATIDLVIYPKSNRSELVPLMIEALDRTCPSSTHYTSIEAIKNIPQNVTINWEKVEREYSKEQNYNEVKQNFKNMLSKFKDLTYFSLSDNVKKKYRGFISNFLILPEESQYILKEIKDGNVLIMDDINTSTNTLKELIRIVKSINPNCKIFIYTLIGR